MTDHPDPYRLSRVVVPRRYTLTFEPDFDDFTFRGTAEIEVFTEKDLSEIVLNANGIRIDLAHIVDDDGNQISARVSYQAAEERATLHLDRVAEAGAWTIHTVHRGDIADNLQGFYRTTYTDESGRDEIIAVTQFESTHAREAFPCFDQPDMKAVFSVTLVVPSGYTAVSNTPVRRRATTVMGNTVFDFEPTMVMSTYLLAFVVGNLEMTGPIEVNGVPIRVIHRPGKGRLAQYALEVGAFALEWLANYYQVPYPSQKIDMIGIPDFAWGAMENLGAITFREAELLIDPERASQGELARVADVIAHEMAHMWFGDLVTMKWWNGIWLNEAFATFVEMKAIDEFRPEWKRWLSFATEQSVGRSTSMEIDGLSTTRPVEFPVHSPADANAMFDALTYGKGAAVLRMLEQYLGDERFRKAISEYLHWYSHRNTETSDLWDSLEAASGIPVARMMEGWITVGGYPIVDVTPVEGGVRLSQHHFRYDGGGDARWEVPIMYRHLDGDGGTLTLDEDRIVDVEAKGLVVNEGGHGFYRVRYTPELLQCLLERLGELDPLERFALVDDSWAFVLSGHASATTFLEVVTAFRDEPEPVVWEAIGSALGELDRVISSDLRPEFQEFVANLVRGAVLKVGWEAHAGDTPLDKRRRGVLLRLLGRVGADTETQDRARRVLDEAVEADVHFDPDVVAAAIDIVSSCGGMDDYEHFLELSQQAATPQETVRYLTAAADIADPAAVDNSIDLVLSGEIRRQDAPRMLTRLLGNRDTGPVAWSHLSSRWEELLAKLPPTTFGRVFDLLPYRSEPETAAEITRFFEGRDLPGGARGYVDQQLERMSVRVELRDRVARSVDVPVIDGAEG